MPGGPRWPSSPASPGRTAPISPNSCSATATSSTASSGAPRNSTPAVSTISTRTCTPRAPQFFLHYGDLSDATNSCASCSKRSPTKSTISARNRTSGSASRRRNTPPTSTRWERCGCSKRSACWSSSRQDPVLSGLDLGALWSGAGDAAARNDAVLSAQPLRGRKALRLLDRRQLPGSLRHARLKRHPVQPREPDPRRNVRHAQDHPRRRGNQTRAPGEALSRQSRGTPRLGPRARFRPRACG